MTHELPDQSRPGDQHPQAERAHSRLVSESWMREFHKQENAALKTDHQGVYTVKRGDTVWTIARRALEHAHQNDPKYHPSNKDVLAEEKAIINANKKLLHNPNLIRPGEQLTIPLPKDAPVAPERPVAPHPTVPHPTVPHPTVPKRPVAPERPATPPAQGGYYQIDPHQGG